MDNALYCKDLCYRESVGYAGRCKRCITAQRTQGVPEDEIQHSVYLGESSCSVPSRFSFHFRDYIQEMNKKKAGGKKGGGGGGGGDREGEGGKRGRRGMRMRIMRGCQLLCHHGWQTIPVSAMAGSSLLTPWMIMTLQ